MLDNERLNQMFRQVASAQGIHRRTYRVSRRGTYRKLGRCTNGYAGAICIHYWMRVTRA